MVSNILEMKKGMAQFSDFFSEQALTVFKIVETSPRQYKVYYQISFWYPILWRPRIIIPGTALIQLSPNGSSISSIQETWDISITDIFLKQLPVRFWDLWNSFSTPSPEYPPMRTLAQVGKVSFVEMPQTVAMEIRWSGPAKYPGPPLLALPGFGLFGFLRTSRPNRDPFYTILPVEVQSGRYMDKNLNEEFKRSSWILHVPTHLQSKIYAQALKETVYPISDDEEEESADDLVDEVDYQVGQENSNIMKSATGGAFRGNVTFDEELMRDFESKERKEYVYRILPKRIIAQVDVRGEAAPEKISAALAEIKDVVREHSQRVLGRSGVKMRMRDFDAEAGVEGVPLLGLQLWSCKACFNEQAQPAMGAYELQYNSRLTRVFVELVID